MRAYLSPVPGHRACAAQSVDPALPASAAGRAHWGSLHDAWQDAADARTTDTPPAKEPLPAGVMIAVAEHRVRANRALRGVLDREPGLRQRIDALQPHARDEQGRNWNIPAPDCGASPRASYEGEFRHIVDALRDQFDLA